MNKNNKDQSIFHKEILFRAIRCLNSSDYEIRSKGIVGLRKESQQSKLARSKLKKLIYDPDGCIRIIAAEALSTTQSYPADAIPVLKTTLEIGLEINITAEIEPWLRICLGALYNYGESAINTENIVWKYLYAQSNKNLKLYTIRLLSCFAKISEESWTILCLLCQHEDLDVKNCAVEMLERCK